MVNRIRVVTRYHNGRPKLVNTPRRRNVKLLKCGRSIPKSRDTLVLRDVLDKREVIIDDDSSSLAKVEVSNPTLRSKGGDVEEKFDDLVPFDIEDVLSDDQEGTSETQGESSLTLHKVLIGSAQEGDEEVDVEELNFCARTTPYHPHRFTTYSPISPKWKDYVEFAYPGWWAFFTQGYNPSSRDFPSIQKLFGHMYPPGMELESDRLSVSPKMLFLRELGRPLKISKSSKGC